MSIAFGTANASLQIVDNGGTINFSSAVLTSLAFPEMLDRRENIESWHINTCQWILELDEYKSWKRQLRGLL
ncbi:hypothetical protein N7478_005833 [Penicillium angulare]|uniref:uncharacterized protein n=1 Tax=Penicillium angulare TaxID=116970 RepID=UPI002541F79E|nr:uncharacterized protein N7478_005833 [Penicillium angulare]KAJ5280461.1 hypothetical protein N7478_005833 [Penicillium angulare]